jgi:TorA maturation chaperone TorD
LENIAAEEQLRRFRREHLEWMIPFCATLRDEARHPFYSLLAEWTIKLLAEE